MKHAFRLTLASVLMGAAMAHAQGPIDWNRIGSDLKFDDMFPRKSAMGRGAASIEWSHDDRYFSYLWNPYDTPGGSDFWLYDTQTGKSTRVTSIEMFAEFDGEIKRSIERYKKDREEEAKRLGLDDMAWRNEVQRLREENERRREPQPSYPGVSEIEWSHKGHEVLMVVKGDVYRWKVGEPKPTRITRTREAETQVEWLPDDSGYIFRRGSNVFRMKFDSAFVDQLNPDLPAGVQFNGYNLSPDAKRMAIFASRPGQPARQVDYITYRDRFATAQKTSRGVSEDDFSGESLVYIFNVDENETLDGKPTEVWKWSGGEEWQEISLSSKPWSPDSKRLVFGSWKRDKKELFIHVADAEAKKVDVVYKTTSDGEHGTPGMADPMFTPDGQQIVLLLDTSGFRHAHVLDPKIGGARQLTQGNYEAYPVGISPDGKTVFVRASKEHPSRMDLYAVDFESGAMRRLTREVGNYEGYVLNHKADAFTSTFRSWSALRELVLNQNGRETTITDSHNKDAFFKNVRLKPELFSYTNRNGQTIHGFMFLPPGFKKEDKRPLMIYVYGGPLGEGKSVTNGDFQSTSFMFAQYLSYALGYVTVTIDPRGQSGYGAAFGRANWENVGMPQTQDLQDGVNWLIANYGVDPKRVALNGWSFGGFQTIHAMLNAPETFTLGIAGAGPTQWQNYNTWYTGGVIGNAPKGDGKYLDKWSLTHVAKNLRNPLMLLHGVEDTNVLFQDTVMLYRELLQMGKGELVELAIDPTGGHGMGGDMNNRDRHAIYLAFLLKHWGYPVKK